MLDFVSFFNALCHEFENVFSSMKVEFDCEFSILNM